MNALALLRGLAANNAWSNLRLQRACNALQEGEFGALRTSFFPSLVATLNHIFIVDDYYMDAMQGGGKGLTAFEDEVPHKTIDALARAQAKLDRKLIDFVDGIAGEDALEREVRMERTGRIQVEKLGDVLMHVFTHQTHHRGQVHAMLAGTSVKPPQLDEYFMTDDSALRREELEHLGLPVQ